MTRTIALIFFAAAPSFALAAGGSDYNPPKPTSTTTQCKDGQIYDEELEACVMIEDSSMNMEDAYDAVRELAYAGRYNDAQMVLATMDQADDRTQTYWGFTHRKMGNMDLAMAAYYGALATNPDNILVRSYMGQAYVEMGALNLAQAQLTEIKARGGRETWAERSLALAIQSGTSSTY